MDVRASLSGLLMAAATLIVLPAAAGPLYTLENATTLPSTNTGWDYVSLTPPQVGCLWTAASTG